MNVQEELRCLSIEFRGISFHSVINSQYVKCITFVWLTENVKHSMSAAGPPIYPAAQPHVAVSNQISSQGQLVKCLKKSMTHAGVNQLIALKLRNKNARPDKKQKQWHQYLALFMPGFQSPFVKGIVVPI